ncbi:hypothetical protein [Aurantivibrio infirmus]
MFDMKCPQCQTIPESLKVKLLSDRFNPAFCQGCGAKYYVSRALSGFVFHGIVGSGIIFILLLLGFSELRWLGLALVLVGVVLAWVVSAMIESKFFDSKILTKEMQAKDRRFQNWLRIIVLSIIIALSVMVLI